MNYGAIIKRAWRITWDHKVLWVLGLFVASGGGWGGSGFRYRYDAQDFRTSELSRYVDAHAAYSYLEDWFPVILAAIVLLFLFAILWAVIGLAAQGGLVQQVNEAAEGRGVSLRRGWASGFHYWGRLAIAGILLMLPLVAIGAIGAFVWVVTIILPLAFGNTLGVGSWAAVAAAMALLVPVTIVAGFLLTNLHSLAVRFIVLEDRRSADAISAAWGVVRHRFKDVFIVWLITVAFGIGIGLAIAVPALLFGIGIAITIMVSAWPVAVLAGLALLGLALLISAGFNTFVSAVWTIFFRGVTGRELPPQEVWAGAPATGYPPEGYGPSGGYAEAPPVALAPEPSGDVAPPVAAPVPPPAPWPPEPDAPPVAPAP